MSTRNVFEEPNRELTADEKAEVDDLFDEAAELMNLLVRLESWCDPRCLAIARTHLETAMLYAAQAASKSQVK